MMEYVAYVIVLLMCGQDDATQFDHMMSEPFDTSFSMDCYESGSIGYSGPTIYHYKDHNEVQWADFFNRKMRIFT